MTAEFELRLLRFLASLRAKLAGSRDPDQALRSALRAVADFFDARAACLVVRSPGGEEPRIRFSVPAAHAWDLELLTRFLERKRVFAPKGLLLVPVDRKKRSWGALVVQSRLDMVGPEPHRVLLPIAETLSELIQRIDGDRRREIRAIIDRKIMEEIRPKDLFYQILHGLRTLTGYDHSAALLMAVDGNETLEVAAEQIAWRKGKSPKVGRQIRVPAELRAVLLDGAVRGFDRDGDRWRAWPESGALPLAGMLDYNDGPEDEVREAVMICAPLATRDDVLGVLKIASRHPDSLGLYEAELVRAFLPQVSVALQNSRRTESLHARTLEAEKRNALASLARGVAHDVNNALGSVLPLVQQIRDDCRAGDVDPEVLARDAESIERSLQVCRRIFGGMLAFARGSAHGGGEADLGRALESALALLEDGMTRHGIRRAWDLPERLPPIRGRQTDLEQVFFNLFANARDAMPGGGTLAVSARVLARTVEVTVADDGTGIAEADLPRVHEPFFTTKPHGTGLGLSICRSLLWEMGGEMHLKTQAGRGTTVWVLLPAVGAPAPEASS